MFRIIDYFMEAAFGDLQGEVDRLLDMPVADALLALAQKAKNHSIAHWVAFTTVLTSRTTGERGGEAYALGKIADGLRRQTYPNEALRKGAPDEIAGGLEELQYEKAMRRETNSSGNDK